MLSILAAVMHRKIPRAAWKDTGGMVPLVSGEQAAKSLLAISSQVFALTNGDSRVFPAKGSLLSAREI